MPFTPDTKKKTGKGTFIPDTPKVLNEQHPELGMGQRAVAQNLTGGDPGIQERYLQGQGFETAPGGLIRKKGEKDWRGTEEDSGFWKTLGRVASFAPALLPGGAGYASVKSMARDPKGAAELVNDATDEAGTFLKTGAAALGGAGGVLAGSPGGPAGSAALGTVGATLGAGAADESLMWLGKLLGVPTNYKEITTTATRNAPITALSVPTGQAATQAVGAVLKQIPKSVKWGGEKMQAPYRKLKDWETKAKDVLDEVSGRKSEEATIAATRGQERATRSAEMQKRFDALQQSAEERLAYRARSKQEVATKAGESVKASEFTKEQRRATAEAKQLAEEIAILDKNDPSRALLEDKLAGLRAYAKEQSEKAMEVRSRKGLYDLGIEQRDAEEAAARAGGATVKPPAARPAGEPIPETPEAPTPKASRLSRADVEKDVGSRMVDDIMESHRISAEAAQIRHEANQIAATHGGSEAWDRAYLIRKRAEDYAATERARIRKEGTQFAVDRFKALGASEEEAQRMAADVAKVAEIRAALKAQVKPTSPADIPPMRPETEMRDQMERMPSETAREVIDALRMYPHIGRSSFFRVTGEGLAKSAALAGHGVKKLSGKIPTGGSTGGDLWKQVGARYKISDYFQDEDSAKTKSRRPTKSRSR